MNTIFLSDKGTAANNALSAARETHEAARGTWAAIKETFGGYSQEETDENRGEFIARRIAVRLDQATARAYGVVSGSACGLYYVTASGQVAVVYSTSTGSDYFDGVRYIDAAGNESRYEEEAPVSEAVKFFDTLDQARAAL
jgi:hypothetical protein